MTARQYNFGDLVRVAGYDDRLFIVDGYRIEQFYYPDEEWTDVVYELADAHSGDWLEADEEDLRLVAKAEKASEYLAQYQPAKGGEKPVFEFSRSKPKASPEIERRNKERERERKINELLDERNDYARLLDEFGDEEYARRIARIDAKLRGIE